MNSQSVDNAPDALAPWLLESKYYLTLTEKLSALPAGPGCYLMKNSQHEVVYVGKAVSLKNRVRSYFQKPGGDTSERTRLLVREIADLDWIVTDSELEALILESTPLQQHRP